MYVFPLHEHQHQPFYPILSYPILSYPIIPYPIISYSILSESEVVVPDDVCLGGPLVAHLGGHALREVQALHALHPPAAEEERPRAVPHVAALPVRGHIHGRGVDLQRTRHQQGLAVLHQQEDARPAPAAVRVQGALPGGQAAARSRLRVAVACLHDLPAHQTQGSGASLLHSPNLVWQLVLRVQLCVQRGQGHEGCSVPHPHPEMRQVEVSVGQRVSGVVAHRVCAREAAEEGGVHRQRQGQRSSSSSTTTDTATATEEGAAGVVDVVIARL
jgi:hypothetical protein